MTVDNIHSALASLVGALSDIELLEDNPRRGDVEAIKKSLQTFGQVVPLLFAERDGKKVWVHGNHRAIAMTELGWTGCARLDVTGYEPDELDALILALNRTSELGGYDPVKVAKMIAGIQDGALVLAAGYQPVDMRTLADNIKRSDSDVRDALLNVTPPDDGPDNYYVKPNDGIVEEITDIATTNECPKCHFQW